MPTRDLRGEEVPVGKVERRLRYDGLAASESTAWMTRVGAASESKDDIASSRGELQLSVTDGVGGYELPQFDPDSFRELRLRVALRHDISDDGVVRIGFDDADGASNPENWCYYRESGETAARRGGAVSCGQLSFGRDGDETSSDNLAIVLDASGGAAVLEVRIRPFEHGATVALGGAGRGDVAYEDADCPFSFDGPVRPAIRIDASESTETETLSLASVEVSALHN